MKKILFRISALLIGIGFVLISLELFLRFNPKFGYHYQSFNFLDKQEASYVQAQYFTSHSYRPSVFLGYEHIPHGQHGRINSYGLVGREYKLEKDKDVFRILVLGDSIAEQGWPCEFLEDQLNNNLPRSRYKFEIWNAGVGGYDVRRYAAYLKYKGLKYNPDMVIVFLFMNDFNAETNIYYKTGVSTVYSFPLSKISKRYPISPFLMRYSYLYRFIILRIDSCLLNKTKTQGSDPQEETGKYYLRLIKDMCESRKIPLFVIIFPYLKPLDKYQGYQIEEYQAICKVTKELKMNYLNLYESLPTSSLYSMKQTKEDEMHPNQEGHRIIARIIYNYLLDNFFKND